jgi:hypothetical protein
MASRPQLTGSIDAAQADTPGYVAPRLIVLGTLVELTQLGSAHTDELLNDGSQP